VHLWNEWNQEYLQADFPRLLIRFEDQLFHGEKVMQLISNCSGIPLKEPYIYQWSESKLHGKSSNLISAISKYGKRQRMKVSWTKPDLEFAKAYLDPTLLRVFGYESEADRPRVSFLSHLELFRAWVG
jgi:hypothetical protein